MLRALLAALVLANLLFFAWSQGWLARAIGSTPYSEREPQRLGAQVRPETIKVLPPGAASAPEGEPSAAAPPGPATASVPGSGAATPPAAADAASASASAPV